MGYILGFIIFTGKAAVFYWKVWPYLQPYVKPLIFRDQKNPNFRRRIYYKTAIGQVRTGTVNNLMLYLALRGFTAREAEFIKNYVRKRPHAQTKSQPEPLRLVGRRMA